MRFAGSTSLMIFATTLAALPASATAETRAAYLERLKEVCAVECLQPRDLQRKARKRDSADETDMAVIMDVAFVQVTGDTFELFNIDTSSSQLVDVEILGSAGINTSSGTGIGGLPRGRRANVSPNVVIVRLDKQAFADILNPPTVETVPGEAVQARDDEDILVESERQRKKVKPGLAALKSFFLNRRIVVRGQPELSVQWVGGRRDHRRKQVSLLVDNADDLVMLPRYDDDGEPLPEDVPWTKEAAQPSAR